MDQRKVFPRKKKVFLTIGQKTQILHEFESGCAITDLCKKYNIDQSVIYKWKRKQGILQMNAQKYADSKIFRVNRNRYINDAVFQWFREFKKSDVLPSGPAIKTKALAYYEHIGQNTEFVASTGWLDWWKKTYNINQLRVDSDIAAKRTSAITSLIKEKGLCLKQIFCADETVLYYKTLPYNLASGNIKLESIENVEDRLTMLPCCNEDGSLKLPLLVLGKSNYTKVSKTHPKAIYINERHVWMNRRIFQHWFENEFLPRVKIFLIQQRLPMKAVLIVDQTHSFNIDQTFVSDDIKILFLPPVMPMTHPLNQGVVESLKKRYRIDFLTAFVNSLQKEEDPNEFLEAVGVEHALSWLSRAWSSVDSKSIANCWLPFLSSHYQVESQMVTTENDARNLSDQLVDIFVQLFKWSNDQMVNVHDVENWVNGDQVHFCNTELDDVIIASTIEENQMNNQDPIENHVFIKKEEALEELKEEVPEESILDNLKADQDPLELAEENGTDTEEILNAFDKVIAYCQEKQIANSNELDTLMYLRGKV